MKKIIVTAWVSLDGFIAGPSDEMDWLLVDDEMGQYETDLVDNADTLLLGRTTYQSFAGSWPHVPSNPDASDKEKDYAHKLNDMHKVVVSSTLHTVDWKNSVLMPELTTEAVQRLKDGNDKDIIIYGSASVVRTLTELGLVDEYQLLVHPSILGTGKHLFANVALRQTLKLIEAKPFKSGVVLLRYDH